MLICVLVIAYSSNPRRLSAESSFLPHTSTRTANNKYCVRRGGRGYAGRSVRCCLSLLVDGAVLCRRCCRCWSAEFSQPGVVSVRGRRSEWCQLVPGLLIEFKVKNSDSDAFKAEKSRNQYLFWWEGFELRASVTLIHMLVIGRTFQAMALMTIRNKSQV